MPGCWVARQTPWLDSIAAAGVVSENGYCNHPLCVPSRMSFLTSRHSHRIRSWDNSDSLDSNVLTLLDAAGAAPLPGQEGQLFNLETDPGERQDVAGDPGRCRRGAMGNCSKRRVCAAWPRARSEPR